MKSAGEKYPQHMQHQHDHQKIGTPVVKIADEASERDLGNDGLDRCIGVHRSGDIDEFQQDASCHLQCHQGDGHTAQSPGQGHSQGLFFYGRRPEMKNQIAA
jgi:hypothetical protein